MNLYVILVIGVGVSLLARFTSTGGRHRGVAVSDGYHVDPTGAARHPPLPRFSGRFA